MFWSGVLLAMVLSIDGFIAGLSYGVRKISVPIRSLLVIAGCTGAGMAASMLFGEAISGFVPGDPGRFGGLVLIGVGCWHLFQAWSEYVRTLVAAEGADGSLFALRVRPLKIVVHVLAEPAQVDRDLSGTIDTKEAVVLGAALGLDTIGAGLAAAMLGYSLFLIVIVTVILPLLVWTGMAVGRRYGPGPLGHRGMFLPGVILMLMGILQF